jgi:predicted enzyme related to lactoylglutathione lyase
MLRHVKFTSLPVVDQDRALAFYRDRLGLTVATDEAYGGDWRWIELVLPEAQTRIVFSRREGQPSKEPVLNLICDDVDETCRDLVDKGVSFALDPTEAPWRADERYALLRDSEGNLVMLGSG